MHVNMRCFSAVFLCGNAQSCPWARAYVGILGFIPTYMCVYIPVCVILLREIISGNVHWPDPQPVLGFFRCTVLIFWRSHLVKLKAYASTITMRAYTYYTWPPYQDRESCSHSILAYTYTHNGLLMCCTVALLNLYSLSPHALYRGPEYLSFVNL